MMYNFRDCHVFVLESYFNKFSSLKPITIKEYKQVILDFICFSHEINSEDLENSILFIFKRSLDEFGFKIPTEKLKANMLIYLKYLLKILSIIDLLVINRNYYKSKNKAEIVQPPKIFIKFFCAKKLLLRKQYHDAIILNFIYTYAIDSYVIHTLSYEGIFEEGLLKFWDYKSSTIQTKAIRKDLIND